MSNRRSQGADIARKRAAPCRQDLRSERGSVLIEFGLAGLLFFLLLLGLTEFSRAMWLYTSMTHAAREGTRYAIVRGSESGRAVTANDMETYVRGRVPGLDAATVTTTWISNNNPGSSVQVQVQQTFVPLVPFLTSIPLTATSRMVITF